MSTKSAGIVTNPAANFKRMTRGKNTSIMVDKENGFLYIKCNLDGERWESNGPAKSQMVFSGNDTYEYNGKNCVVTLNSYEKNTKSNMALQNKALMDRIAELEAASK